MTELSAGSYPSELNPVESSPMTGEGGGVHHSMSDITQCCFDHEMNQNFLGGGRGYIARQSLCNLILVHLHPGAGGGGTSPGNLLPTLVFAERGVTLPTNLGGGGGVHCPMLL